MATQIVPAPVSAERTPTAPLPPAAVAALSRLELALADQIVANFDNYGSCWGFSTAEEAEKAIVKERAGGAAIDEWETVDRDGQPLRIVRVEDPTFLDTISVFSAWSHVRVPLEIQRAATRFTIAAARYDELAARPASALTAAEFDGLKDAQQVVHESFATLAEAGMTRLVRGV
ncbi:hypothetical protein AB0M68_03735 [Streptomyces sp. NPDC051453]|uniref:hypothetical protein n=1 Tax=Streptomyces sp. NPDC051453 TaxID=3154941 RepID=UPI00341A4442